MKFLELLCLADVGYSTCEGIPLYEYNLSRSVYALLLNPMISMDWILFRREDEENASSLIVRIDTLRIDYLYLTVVVY